MTSHAELKVGHEVGYHSYAWGWRYGKVIGLHVANIGQNADGLEHATVRFYAERGLPTEDHALPCFLLYLSKDSDGSPLMFHKTHDETGKLFTRK